LQLKLSHEFASPLLDRHFLQDGYLIYNKIAGTLQYGYVDLLTAVPDEELCWAHISREDIRHPLCVVFSVDNNLAVVLRTQQVRPGSLVKLTFLDFLTGAPHPLSSKPTVRLPSNTVVDVAYAEAEILGDYVLITVMSGRDVCCFYLVSWKSGVVTLLRDIELSNRWRPLWVPRLVGIDDGLIMLANCTKNSLEICKLEFASQEPPRLHTVCFLELPALEPYAFVIVSRVDKEWVPTSSWCGTRSQQQQQLPRKRVVPFRSSKVGTIGLLLEHEMRTASVRVLPSCWMTVSIAALLSAIYYGCSSSSDSSDDDDDHTGGNTAVRTLYWPDWGPTATRVLVSSHGGRLPKPAGPFWITSFSPLVIRDYDVLRMRSTRAAAAAEAEEEEEDDKTSSLFGPPVFKSTEVLGEHWVEGKLVTRLPYRDIVAKDLYYIGVVADREWIIGISVKGSEGLYYTVYHVG